MPDLQIQARALGDPTRYSIFRYLADASVPVDIAELTARFDLNHNSIRQHLAKLVEARLVLESRAAPRGQGRPRLLYAVEPSTESRWGVIGPYEQLSMLLTEVVRSGDQPEEVGRRAGVRHRLGARAASEAPLAEFARVMGRLGFDPDVKQHDGAAVLTLRSCPYSSAVLTDPGTVCQLHLGLARGIAESVGGLAVDQLIPHDPRTARCELHCRLAAGPDEPAGDETLHRSGPQAGSDSARSRN